VEGSQCRYAEWLNLANEEEQAVYSIGAVARMLDVPTSTLRGWEERYAIVTPNRSRGLQRLYSRSQVEHLRFIKAQIESGKSAADAHRLLTQQLSGGPVRMVPDEPEGERRILILLAERDSYAADLEDYFLRTEGYDVCGATDATQARVLFSERTPDLVIVDLMISGGAGFGLCAEFAGKGSCPVLAVSSIDMPDEAMLAGADAFLPKPLKPLDLVSAVRDLLGTSALARRARRAEVTR
jgi:DNA-binding transcriptional MerR regulator